MRDFRTFCLPKWIACFVVLFGCTLCQPSAEGQVYLVKDINPGGGGTWVFTAGALGSAVYFSAYDGAHGEELWVSDGTAAGTYMVKDIWPDTTPDDTSAYSSMPDLFTAAGSSMYFAASGREEPGSPYNDDYEVWVSDGTDGGTYSLDIWAGVTSSGPSNLVSMGGSLFFSAYDETYGNEVFKATGGSASVLEDIEPDAGNSMPQHLTVVTLSGPSDRLFFSASDTANGRELWMSSGAGASMITNIATGFGSSDPHDIEGFGGKAYFGASDDFNGDELWVSDGTEANTTMLKDINLSGSSSPGNLTAVGSLLFFLADDGTNGRELWKTDGTSSGTEMVKDLVEGSGGSPIQSLTNLDGTLFFANSTAADGTELWTSDGTADGTVMLKNIRPGPDSALPVGSDPPELVVAKGMLFFNANDGVNGAELWVSDGTAAGTLMVADVAEFWSVEGPKGLTVTTDRLFFQTDSNLGRELHALPTANVVSLPAAPTGIASGSTETAHTYSTTGGSISLQGGGVQYRFNWGDGGSTDWLDEGVKSAEHTWIEGREYEITIEARSVLTPTIMSNVSASLAVTMAMNEEISTPTVSGATSGGIGISYPFTFGGDSSYDHDMEYRVDWGDGNSTTWDSLNPSTDTADLSHSWDHADAFQVQVWVRCATHTDVFNWSEHYVTIEEEYMFETTLSGPSSGWTGVTYDYTISGGSSYGHALEYSTSWGDGTPDIPWTAFPTGKTSVVVSHAWDFVAPDFPVWVGVRCALHNALESGDDMTVAISDPPPTDIFADGFESGDITAW